MSRRCCSIVRIASGGEARGGLWGGCNGIGSRTAKLGRRWCTETDLGAEGWGWPRGRLSAWSWGWVVLMDGMVD